MRSRPSEWLFWPIWAALATWRRRGTYLRVDPRAAAIFRITLGTFLCFDTLRHFAEADFLYSNEGVLSNDYHLYRPASGNLFSFFHAFSTWREVSVLFALGLICHLCLVVGYRTRLFSILSFLFVTSRDSRMVLVENGGYVVENLACMWACFLPLGQRFSIDAWRASWRAKKETTLADLAPAARPVAPKTAVRTLVGLAVVVNLAFIYLFNVVNKTGYIWREGNTVHYVLHIDRMVTGIGVFVREHFPLALLKVADFTVLAVEATICACIISPHARKFTRPLAMILMIGLHTTLGLFMRLGPFSWALISWSPILLLPIHFERMDRFYRARSGGCELGIDTSDPFALTVARVVARLDHGGRVAIVEAPEGSVLAVKPVGANDAAWITAPRAMIRPLADALPFGRWFHRALRVVTLGQFDRGVSFVFERRTGIASLFGLTTTPVPDAAAPSPFDGRVAKAKTYFREALIGYLVLCATLQTWMENKIILKSIPPPLKEGQELRADERWWYDLAKRTLGGRTIPLKPERSPEFLQWTVTYPRTFQGWGMFAPNPIREDGVLAVDALTIDGRHVDPLTGRAPDLNLLDSRGEGLSQLRQDYGNRIRLDRNEPYRDQFRDYLLRYPSRTKNPKDELIAIDVYWVRDECPAPGQTKPQNNEAVPIISWRKAGYKPEAGGPALPPKLTTRSAEKPESKKKR
ncbi:MAG: hypothetical protein HOW73_34970 [Polyangiaceae bacterium]|nr:hypothetical protein [Polyangiaceae bacterium]